MPGTAAAAGAGAQGAPSTQAQAPHPIKAKVTRLGSDLMQTFKSVGQWASNKLGGDGASGGSTSCTGPPAALPRSTGPPEGRYPVREDLAPAQVPHAAALVMSPVPLSAASLSPLSPPPAPLPPVPSEWKFCPRDTVVTLEAAVLHDLDRGDDVAVPADAEVVVTGPVDGGLVPVRYAEAHGMFPAAKLTHPILTVRVDAGYVPGCDVHCDAAAGSPVMRRLLNGDAVNILRVRDTGVGGYWLQTSDGGWVAAHGCLRPELHAGVVVVVNVTIPFDNEKKVSSGCLGRVTRVPGDAAGSVAEVLADGVLWDALPHHVTAVLPQSQLTLPAVLARRGSSAGRAALDRAGVDVDDETADIDATVYSDGGCEDGFSDAEALSDVMSPLGR